jgi:N-acetylneuraminic acid mutarotase
MEDQSLTFQLLPTPFPNARNNHASVAFNGSSIITVGGSDNYGNTSFAVTLHNAKTEEFTKFPKMNKPVSHHTTALLDGHVYVIGGIQGRNWTGLKDVIRMNLLSRKWEVVESMIEERRGHCTAVHNDTIYSFGGYNERSAECYTIGGFSGWRYIPPMEQERLGAAAVTVVHNIYVLGGYIDGVPSSSMIAFNTSNVTCNEMAPMPFGLADCAAAVYSKYIIVLGGLCEDGITVSDKCLVYDTETDVWFDPDVSSAQFTTPRYQHTAVLLDSRRLVITGGRGGGGKATKALESIHVLGILPPDVRQREIRAVDDQGRLPIHAGAEHGLGFQQGMRYLVNNFPESLEIQSNNGDIPIILAASGPNADLTMIYELFKAMLGFNYVQFAHMLV